MGDEPRYVEPLVRLADGFVSSLRPVLGDAAREREMCAKAIEDYRANRRAHGIQPEDEGAAHFFLSDGVIDGSGKRLRKPPVVALGDAAAGARISELLCEFLDI